jgi:hypothetical protein
MPALTLALIGVSLVHPPEASAETLHWRVKNNYAYTIYIAFYSQSRSVAWPGWSRSYILNTDATYDVDLSCYSGEYICLGGWLGPGFRNYWGVGYNKSQGCADCCYACGGDDPPIQELD